MDMISFTGANFRGWIGIGFRFRTLGDDDKPLGKPLVGKVKRVFRRGRQVCVEIHIPALRCVHTYEAKRLYFLGDVPIKTEEAY